MRGAEPAVPPRTAYRTAIGGPRDRNSFYALVVGGNGITFSLIAAEIIRDRILGRPDPDNNMFLFRR